MTADLEKTVNDLTERLIAFDSLSEKNQLQIIPALQAIGEPGFKVLMDFLIAQPRENPTIVAGAAYQTLYQSELAIAQSFLTENFPTGIVPLKSDRGIDYLPLQQLLAQQDFEPADRLTLQKLCELAGPLALARKWLYFTEVETFPITDLQTINRLWLIHSQGKFGFSVQRELWLAMGKNWEKLWPLIGWKNGNIWTRYPGGFTWSLSAPKGHLPLSNQLRGVRVFSSLLSHPAWTTSSTP